MARGSCVLRRALLTALVCRLELWQATASVNFAYMVYWPAGNVVSFGDLTGLGSPDLLSEVTVAPDTGYTLCYFMGNAGR